MDEADYILTEEQAKEAWDDLIVRVAISSYMKLHGQQLREKNERLRQDPAYQITPEAKTRFRRIVNRAFRKQSVTLTLKGVYKVANKVAMLVLAVVTVFSATMFASAEFRSAIYRLILTKEDKYTLIELDSRTKMEFVGSEAYTWEHAFAPTVMPEGYTVSDVIETSVTRNVIYTHVSGNQIVFFQDNGQGQKTLQIDTENAQLVQNVFINDSEGILSSKDGLNILVWRAGSTMLSLTSTEDSAMLIAVANGIKLLG